MKKLLLLMISALCLCILASAQHLEATLKIVGNKARIVVKAVGGPITGSPTGMTFSVAIPVASSAASMITPTVLDAAHLPPNLSLPIGNYMDGTYEYFNLVYTGAPASATFANGTEIELLELNWAGAAQSADISLVSMPDGNPAAGDVPGNWFTFLEVGGVQVSDPTALYYQSGSTGTPTQPVDYTTPNGVLGIITTSGLISLPVNIVNFSGYKSGSKNSLRWTTASESNNKGFEILRSADGVNYSSIGFVGSLAAGGNSSSSLSYTFDDMNPAGKKQYYRLNQTDKDGQGRLSNIVIISGEKPFALSIGAVFPNPARSQVNILIDAPRKDEVTIVMMDIDGKVVKQKQASIETGSNTIPVDIANLTSGSYLVKLVCRSSDCVSAVAKFNKQ